MEEKRRKTQLDSKLISLPIARIIGAFLLALIALFAFQSCSGEKGDETETQTPPAEKTFSFAAGCVTDYAVVRGDSASDSVIKSAAKLRKALSEATGAEFRLYDEFSYARAPEPHAIVVGKLGDSAAEAGIISELTSGMRIGDYVIAVRAGELFLLGGSDAAVAEAVDWFTANLPLTESDLILASGYTAKYEADYPLGGLTICGAPVNEFSIVSCGTEASSRLASKIRSLIAEKCGYSLPIVDAGKFSGGRAIYAGSAEDSAIGSMSHYDISDSEENIRFVSGGIRTGDVSVKAFSEYLSSGAVLSSQTVENVSLSGSADEGKAFRMIERSEGTDIRVMQSNVLISSDKYTDAERAMLLTDTYLCYAPDVITLNEYMYNRGITNAVASRIKDYYETVEAPYVGKYPDPENPDANLAARRYATPVLYRKDSGLTLIDSGFSYLSDMISYHGWSYALFEKDGRKVCVFSVHFSDNRTDGTVWRDVFAREVLDAVAKVREKHGDVSFILAGDWYFWPGVLPYKTITGNGFSDAAEHAVHQYSTGVGTFHTVGEGSTGGANEDLIFYSTGLQPLGHRIVVDEYTVKASDHYPVVADFAFDRAG